MKMQPLQPYSASQQVRSLISDNSSLLMVLSRFGIPLGFADKSVQEVCEEQGIDCSTFLAVANFISGRDYESYDINLKPLIDYLKRAHVYFLDFNLPMIRRKLIEAIDCSKTDSLGFLIVRFYDDYVSEVRNHMDFEDRKVFPYVSNLINRAIPNDFTITKFASRHTHITQKLQELKDIIVRYVPENGNDLLNSVLFDIITCEQDLHLHCLAEDQLFVPAVKALEKIVEDEMCRLSMNEEGHYSTTKSGTPDSDAAKINALSDREKEIICNIAKGLTNKEIANKLCLSVHTITTHRRNISAKLQIHSPAGLTIFAIINRLLPPEDIPRPR